MRLELALIISIVFFCVWCTFIVARMSGSVVVGTSESDTPTGNGPTAAAKEESIELYDNPLASSQLHRQSIATSPLRYPSAGDAANQYNTMINGNRLHPNSRPQPQPHPMTRQHQPMMVNAANGSLMYQQQQQQQQQQPQQQQQRHHYLPQTLPLRPIYQHNMSAVAATPPKFPRGRALAGDSMTDGSHAAHQLPIAQLAPPQVYDTTSYSYPAGRIAGAARQGPSYVSDSVRTVEPYDANEDGSEEQQDDAADESRVQEPEVDASQEQDAGQQQQEPQQPAPEQDGDLDERSGGREFSEDESETTERDRDGNDVVKERKHLINGRPVSRTGEPHEAESDAASEGETDAQVDDAASADNRREQPRLTSRSGDLISVNNNKNANRKRDQMRRDLNDFNELVGEFEADDKQRRSRQEQSKQEDQVMDERMDSGGSKPLPRKPPPNVNGLPLPVRSRLSAGGVLGGGHRSKVRRTRRGRLPVQRKSRRRVLQAAKTTVKPSDLHEHRLTETLSSQQWDDDQRNGLPESSSGKLRGRELPTSDGSVLPKEEQAGSGGGGGGGGGSGSDDDDEQADNDADQSERVGRGPEADNANDNGEQVDAPSTEPTNDEMSDDDEEDDDDDLDEDSLQSSASGQVPSRESILARVKRAVEKASLSNETSRNTSANLQVDPSSVRLLEPIKGAEDLNVEVLAEPPAQVNIDTGGGASAIYTTEPVGGSSTRNGSSPGARYVAVAPAQLVAASVLPVSPPYASDRLQVHQVAVEAPEPFPLGVVANYDAVTKESAPKVKKSGKKGKKKKKYASEKKRSMMSESKYNAAKAQSAKRKSKLRKGGKKMKKRKSHKHLHAMDKYFSGAQSGKKAAKGKGLKGADTGELYYKDKGFKKKGFKRAYHKVESGDHKSYFDEFRDKDHKKKWKKYNDKHKYSQRKKWKGGEKKRVAGHKLDESKAKKLHKGKWKSSEMHKYGKSGKRKHAKAKSAHGKWKKYKEKEHSEKYKKSKSHH